MTIVNMTQTQTKTEAEWLHEIGRHITRGNTLDEALATIVGFATALVNCDHCLIYLRDGAKLALWVQKHLDQEPLAHTRFPLGQGHRAVLEQHRVPIASSSNSREHAEARVFDQWSTDPGETFVLIPLLTSKELVGAISLEHRRPRGYNLREVKLLSAVGRLLGAGIEISGSKEIAPTTLKADVRQSIGQD